MSDPFGVWLRLPDVAHAHYFLPGCRRCLCRVHKRPDPEVQAVVTNSGHARREDTVDRDCLAANERRWLRMYSCTRASNGTVAENVAGGVRAGAAAGGAGGATGRAATG